VIFRIAGFAGFSGLQDCRIAGLQDCRISGFQDFRISGLQDCRIAGLQDCRIAGLQDCRITGLQDCRIQPQPQPFDTPSATCPESRESGKDSGQALTLTKKGHSVFPLIISHTFLTFSLLN
jgi:hypothetical protein